MTESSNILLTKPDSWPNPAVERLAMLVGTWDFEIMMPGDHPPIKGGQAVFEWLDQGYFLALRSHAGRDDFPKNYSLIGSDGTMGSYTMIYYDSRGVSRIYQMSLENGVWKLWRDDPDFPQRFIGTFSDDGKTIKAAWEKAPDGSEWQLDFHLTYTKAD